MDTSLATLRPPCTIRKPSIAEYLLNKPGSLTPFEFARTKLHAAKGAAIPAAV